MPTPRKRVLLVGAYERDNFGDLLFLVQTEHYLRHHDLVAAAPFPGDMTRLLDRTIPAYGPMLERDPFDAVWTVGGEVGATTFAGAVSMSLPPSTYRRYRDADDSEKAELLVELQGNVHQDTPYMPRLSLYPQNLGAASVLHSIGLAGVRKQPPTRRRDILHVLREASAINVRDANSSALLNEHGIVHTLAPDLVHTLTRTRPRPRPARPTDVLIQISHAHLAKAGHEAYARAIVGSRGLQGLPIRLFLAGTARGHDSVRSYRRLIAAVRALEPAVDIAICPARRPLDLVDAIASARLWIGLSLHGRIVSAAYGVPRVSLKKRKLDDYARSWDPDMPYGVTEDTLADAVATALDPSLIRRTAGLGSELAEKSERAIVSATEHAFEGSREAMLERRMLLLEQWRELQQVEAKTALERASRRLQEQEGRKAVRIADRLGREHSRLRELLKRPR